METDVLVVQRFRKLLRNVQILVVIAAFSFLKTYRKVNSPLQHLLGPRQNAAKNAVQVGVNPNLHRRSNLPSRSFLRLSCCYHLRIPAQGRNLNCMGLMMGDHRKES